MDRENGLKRERQTDRSIDHISGVSGEWVERDIEKKKINKKRKTKYICKEKGRYIISHQCNPRYFGNLAWEREERARKRDRGE